MRSLLALACVLVVAASCLVATCGDDAVAPPEPTSAERARTGTTSPARATPRRRAATPAAEAPVAAGAEVSSSFPAFAARGGPTLLRRDANGRAFVLEPEGDGAWHDLGVVGDHLPVASAGPGRLLMRRSELALPHWTVVEPRSEAAEPTIADLALGTVTQAFPGRPVRVVTVADGAVIAIDVTDRVLVRRDRDGRVSVLDARDVRLVAATSPRHAFVVTDADGFRRVPFDGGPSSRLDVTPPRFGPPRVAPSPSGRYLAVAGERWSRADGAEAEPALRVLDCDSGAELWRLADVEVRVSPLSSLLPELEVSWADDTRLRFSESFRRDGGAGGNALDADGWGQRWVEVWATTGQRLREVPYAQSLGLRHSRPPTTPDFGTNDATATDGVRAGLFRTRGPLVWFGDDVEPAATAVWGPGADTGAYRTIDPSGRWAAVCVTDEGGRAVLLLDGRTRERRVVHRGDVTALLWMAQ